jgi:hypothetical protein
VDLAPGLSASRSADLHVPVLSQLTAAQLSLRDALELGSLEVISLDTSLGRGPLGKQALRRAAGPGRPRGTRRSPPPVTRRSAVSTKPLSDPAIYRT